ncbi:MAG: bifunctional [glutamate--ammonia ligase]-adenylyl-L-tyrosine phosphorylase/[glutamate--ammonia-ligase] adenylyltransferase [Gammaproteobacteria bacterium]|nr:bifunctional [glutamate--ammonia ligase]-adenylyl-L-tyrosine phosphorylase/[glutamate--ammonia-ligase] adenylyltransferase [Gammaproteobacteria bacterium]
MKSSHPTPPAPEVAARRATDAGPLPPALQHQVELYWEQYTAAAAETGIPVPRHAETLDVLRRVWAYSGFVAGNCTEHPDLLRGLLESGDLLLSYGPDRYDRLTADALSGVRDGDGLDGALRRLRRREMTRIAWRDLAGWAGLEETLRELSWLAEALIDGAAGWLHTHLAHTLGAPHGARSSAPQRLVVLGMGKLGAYELNFSSDIDLIFAYPEEGSTRGRRARVDNEEFFTELGKRLIGCLSRPTEDGFVFRTDMRLRPFGTSGPLVMSFEQMEDYYQSQGREWERYAMIKARPVAGDRAQGRLLLQTLRPFVYRRYLDFSVFESLREMKALINQEVAKRDLEDNIKLGPGGIREIEFIGQTFQLIRGGREPALQEQRILPILRRLAAAGHLPEEAAAELEHAYRFLRRVENRLQMAADRQTHQLPDDATGRLRLARSMDFPDWEGFARVLVQYRAGVQRHFNQVFNVPRRETEPAGSREGSAPDYGALWSGGLDDGEGVALLTQAGFHDGAEIHRRLGLLRDGHVYRALSERGRARMDRVVPPLLDAAAATPRPDVTLIRLLDLIEQIARRTAYLALLGENPVVLAQLVRLCAASPWISDMLAHQPLLLDELIDPRRLYAPLDRGALERDLRTALEAIAPEDLEQQMETLRHFKHSNVLRVAAADVMEAIPLMVVSDHLTEIAEVVLAEVLSLSSNHLMRRNPGATRRFDRGFAIVAYGKLGGIELGYGSDLDLVFLHAADQDPALAQGYARLAQRIIHLLNTHTPAGILYEVDLRLRPSGSSGLLVSSLSAFEDYQREAAWTWEHQALVRARVVAGDPAVTAEFERIRAAALARPRDPARLREEVGDMRDRMRRELSRDGAGQFDLKQGRGGIADIEFIVQYAVLRWAPEHPELLRWTDNIRPLETLARLGLLPAEDSRLLTDAYRNYRAVVHRLALQETEGTVVDAAQFAAPRAEVARIWDDLLPPPAAPETGGGR